MLEHCKWYPILRVSSHMLVLVTPGKIISEVGGVDTMFPYKNDLLLIMVETFCRMCDGY